MVDRSACCTASPSPSRTPRRSPATAPRSGPTPSSTSSPTADAYIVGALRRAGAIIIGQTTTPEFAHTLRTDSPLWGVTRNPYDTSRTPGGSSGGSGAAVASGLRAAGRGQRHGRLGAHPGGVERRRRAQAGTRAHPDGRPARAVRLDLPPRPARPLRRRRPALPRRHTGTRRRRHHVHPRLRSTFPRRSTPTSPACVSACPSTSAAGLSTRRSPPPSEQPLSASRRQAPRSTRSIRRSPAPTRKPGLCCGECSWRRTSATSSTSSVRVMDPEVVQLIEAGNAGVCCRSASASSCTAPTCGGVSPPCLADHDALLCPTMASPPWPAAKADVVEVPPEDERRLPLPRHDRRVQPRVPVPGGVGAVRSARRPDHAGLPIGLQVVGRRWREDTVLRVARAVELGRARGGR